MSLACSLNLASLSTGGNTIGGLVRASRKSSVVDKPFHSRNSSQVRASSSTCGCAAHLPPLVLSTAPVRRPPGPWVASVVVGLRRLASGGKRRTRTGLVCPAQPPAGARGRRFTPGDSIWRSWEGRLLRRLCPVLQTDSQTVRQQQAFQESWLMDLIVAISVPISIHHRIRLIDRWVSRNSPAITSALSACWVGRCARASAVAGGPSRGRPCLVAGCA